MNRCERLSILIIDDQVEVLEIYQDMLECQLGHVVECANTPGEALQLVRNTMFDVAIIDAKITYKCASLGGLILADEISGILGVNSVLLMSQYEISGEVKYFNPSFSFLPKPRDPENLTEWIEKELMAKIRQLIHRQYGFIIMPFDNEHCNQCYREIITPALNEVGFKIRRMDELPTTRPINHELLQRLRDAHLVVVYTTQPNPNVYFEAGYACANQKFMILLSTNIEDMPFDIRSNHIIPIDESQPDGTRQKIQKFIGALRKSRE